MKPPRHIMLMVLALIMSVTWAQEVIIKAELDTNKALIGDQVKLHLSVEKPAGIQVRFPSFKDTITRDIEITSYSPIDTTAITSERFLLSQVIFISVFDTGFFEIPSLAFIMKAGAKQDTLSTLPVQFEILSVRADSTIRDIKTIYRVPVSFRELYPYILLIIVVGLIIWFLIYYIKNRHDKHNVKPVAYSSEPPDIVALRELEQLKEEKPWIHSKVKFYHIRISEILRIYIERRFNIMALEQTTDEILISLKPPVCQAFDHNRLSEILKLADLVKFAKVVPGVNENAAQVDLAAEFIRNNTVHEVT